MWGILEHGFYPISSLHALSLSNMLLLRTTHLVNV